MESESVEIMYSPGESYTDEKYSSIAEGAVATALTLIADSEGWKEVSTATPDVKAAKKSFSGFPIDTWKVSGLVNCPAEVAADKMWSWAESDWKKFNYNIISWNVVYTASGSLRVCQQLDQLPSPFQPRDSLTVNIKKQIDDKWVLLWTNAHDAKYKKPKDSVRANVNYVCYIFEASPEDPNMSYVTHLVNVDPCGVIPAMVVNSFTDGISNVIHSLCSALQKA